MGFLPAARVFSAASEARLAIATTSRTLRTLNPVPNVVAKAARAAP
jgi:hypothetical protein